MGKARFRRIALAVAIVLATFFSLSACGPAPHPTPTPTAAQRPPTPTPLTATATPAAMATLALVSIEERQPLDLARETLVRFFSLLNEGRYAEAVGFYGGGYEIFRGWNPTIAPNDYAKLLECGCTVNGLQCLKVKEIVTEEEVSPVEFRFTVRFMNDDGSLFTRGPCCGATEEEMPPQSEFIYTVRKVGDRFLVMELPIYVP